MADGEAYRNCKDDETKGEKMRLPLAKNIAEQTLSQAVQSLQTQAFIAIQATPFKLEGKMTSDQLWLDQTYY